MLLQHESIESLGEIGVLINTMWNKYFVVHKYCAYHCNSAKLYLMKNGNISLLIVRLSLGILLLFHGVRTIRYGMSSLEQLLAKDIPDYVAYSVYFGEIYGVYIGEIVAPLMIVLGFRTRLAGLLLLINMLVIILIAQPHVIIAITGSSTWKLESTGFYLAGSLILLLSGGGKYSLSHSKKWD